MLQAALSKRLPKNWANNFFKKVLTNRGFFSILNLKSGYDLPVILIIFGGNYGI